MDLMGYADDASKIMLEDRRLGLASDALALRRSEYEDQHLMDQQRLVEGRFKLAADLQSMMTTQRENEAVKYYDPSNPKSLDLVAGMLAKGGDFAGFASIKKMQGDLAYKQFQASKEMAEANASELKAVGGFAKDMTTPAGYAAGMKAMRGAGYDPAKWNLPDDPAKGIPIAAQIAQSSIPAGTAATIAHQERSDAERERADTMRFNAEMARIGQGEQRAAAAQKRIDVELLNLRQRSDQFEATQTGKKQDRDLAAQRFAVSMQDKVAESARAELDSDERFGGLEIKEKNAYAQLIGNRVSSALAKDPNANYADAVKSTIEKMVSDGEIKPKKTFANRMIDAFNTGTTAAAKATAPTPKEAMAAAKSKGLPYVSGNADKAYVRLPSGAKYVGPDGKIHQKR